MITVTATPCSDAASERAAPWFPEEVVATPFASSTLLSCNKVFVAPRNLNEPVRWKFSHLKNNSAPANALRLRLVSTGVRWIRERMRSWAFRTSSGVTIVVCSFSGWGFTKLLAAQDGGCRCGLPCRLARKACRTTPVPQAPNWRKRRSSASKRSPLIVGIVLLHHFLFHAMKLSV